MTIRLDRFISEQTEHTRSEIKKLLSKGLVTVDGAAVKKGNTPIDTSSVVSVDGREIAYRDKVCYIMNKPQGYVCATEDRTEKTVLELLRPEDRRKDLFPAGRLDKDTVGMVLITNDGELAHRMLSPSGHIPKYYIVKLAEPMKEADIQKFKQGIVLGDGTQCLTANVKLFTNGGNTAFIELFEGKYHQVKRMFASTENKVIKLERVQLGGLENPVKSALGSYVEIMHNEIEQMLTKPDFEGVFEKIKENFSSYWINI